MSIINNVIPVSIAFKPILLSETSTGLALPANTPILQGGIHARDVKLPNLRALVTSEVTSEAMPKEILTSEAASKGVTKAEVEEAPRVVVMPVGVKFMGSVATLMVTVHSMLRPI